MYRLIFDMEFLPPGRGLWSMGTPFMFERGGACLNNCGFVSTDEINREFSAPFVWLMDMSLLGVGVGFDTDGSQLDVELRVPRITKEKHVVEDSREGWTAAFKRVLDSYSGRDTLPSEFDFSEIRGAGSPIKGFGGIAPGPDPLKKLIERTIKLCDTYAGPDLRVDSTLIVDLMNYAGEAVVAGGIRRTAEIAFGSPDDEEFLDLKSEENINNPEKARWASNNSIIGHIGMNYDEIAARAIKNGEPGIFWLDNARAYGRTCDGKTHKDHRVKGCNPCGEQSLESFELCNLVETFPSRHTTLEDYTRTLKYAYMYAKTVTLISTHDPRTNAVMFRNRRIGLSQSGIIEQINKVGFREHLNWCEDGYQTVKKWDVVYSDWLCIPRSRKVTTVKPSGTVSLLPGVTPGIHFPHSEYYIRRVRVNKNSELVGIMKEAGYNVVPDAYEQEHTMVVEFPVHEPHFERSKDQISVWEQFELSAAMQAKWSDNQVSVTITVRKEDEADLAHALTMYEKRLKAVSFLPLRGDKLYKQAPYEKITKEQYEEQSSKIKKVRYDVIGPEDRIEERGCDGDSCVI
jgi:adenosylcobalamin-dependent ribonucleoside-triphosphate reductase